MIFTLQSTKENKKIPPPTKIKKDAGTMFV